MLNKNKIAGFALATAAAAAFMSLPAGAATSEYTTTAPPSGAVSCYGVNSCKGQSSCRTASNECKGLNSCKGRGIEIENDSQTCADEGGSEQP